MGSVVYNSKFENMKKFLKRYHRGGGACDLIKN